MTCFAVPPFLRRIGEFSTRWATISTATGVVITVLLLSVLAEHVREGEYLAPLALGAIVTLAGAWWQWIR